MKSAKTMFEELGFKVYGRGERFLGYEFQSDYDTFILMFDSSLKTYEITRYRYVDMNWQKETYSNVNVDLHNAIHQQMIELGWIK